MIFQSTGPISKIKIPFDSPVCELSKHGTKFNLEGTDDVTGQVKVRMFNFSGLVTSASTISLLSANKANVDSVTDICKYHFLCFVTIIQVKVISGHQLKKVKQKKSRFRAVIHGFRSDFRKEREKITLKHLLKRQNWLKKYNSENHFEVAK